MQPIGPVPEESVCGPRRIGAPQAASLYGPTLGFPAWFARNYALQRRHRGNPAVNWCALLPLWTMYNPKSGPRPRMRIGRDDNFLSIEKPGPADPYSPWRIEAVATGPGQRFSAVHDWVMLDTSAPAVQRFADFEALRTRRVEIPLTEGGWLRLERDARGYVTVHYRVGGSKARAALKGEVTVEGEFAGSFCREFGALLRSAR